VRNGLVIYVRVYASAAEARAAVSPD
jgi:hypothetical protein